MKTSSTFASKLLLAAALASYPVSSALAAPSTADYVAHEWGTFTSVQGSDGVQMEWNPFTVWDLPEFVYERTRPTRSTNDAYLELLLSKSEYRAQQRMETPVIYFYSEDPLDVSVEVEFPEGTITEWYPQASAFGPLFKRLGNLEPTNRSFLRWNNVQVLAPQKTSNDRRMLPHDPSINHYYAARNTDANQVRVQAQGPAGLENEQEAFLFYRGVGQFQAPLQVSLSSGEVTLSVHNTGAEPLKELFLVEIDQGEGRFLPLGDLHPDRSQGVTIETLEAGGQFQSLDGFKREIGAHLASALVREGLYKKEAAAMIQTWKDSWFGEEGLRVLYILPSAWTDDTLHLNLNPAPREMVRVLVGRAEVLRPSTEWEFLRQVVHFNDAPDEVGRSRAIEAVRAMRLGRFAEPLSHRVLGKRAHPDFYRAVQNVVQSLN